MKKTENDESKVLDEKEWKLLYRFAILNSALLCRRLSVSQGFFNIVVQSTIGFHRFSGEVSFRELKNGAPHLCYFGIGGNRNTQCKSRRILKQLGLANFDYPSEPGDRMVYKIRINVPGILRALQSLAIVKAEKDTRWFATVATINDILKKVSAFWHKKGWESPKVKVADALEDHMKLEDAEGEGKQKSAQAKRKKRSKIEEAGEVRPSMVLELMKQYCEELEMPYSGIGSSTKKDMGCAKNWLNECKIAAVDWKVLLFDVCECWSGFYNRLLWENKRQIRLSSSVNFREFYKHRTAIESWLTREGKEFKEAAEKYRIEEAMTPEEKAREFAKWRRRKDEEAKDIKLKEEELQKEKEKYAFDSNPDNFTPPEYVGMAAVEDPDDEDDLERMFKESKKRLAEEEKLAEEDRERNKKANIEKYRKQGGFL